MKTDLRAITGLTLATTGAALALTAVTPANASVLNLLDNGDGTATGYWSVPATTWPQPAIDPHALCGVVQADVYPFATDADKERTNTIAADARLDEGEDYGWAITWTVKDHGPCPTPTESTPATTTPPTTTPPATEPTGAPTPTTTPSSTPPVVPSPPATETPSPAPSTTATSSPSALPTDSASPIPSTPPTATPTAPQTAPATSPTTAATSPSPSQPTTQSQHATPGGKNSSNQLAYTGSRNPAPLLGIAALMTIGGAVLLAIEKKRKA